MQISPSHTPVQQRPHIALYSGWIILAICLSLVGAVFTDFKLTMIVMAPETAQLFTKTKTFEGPLHLLLACLMILFYALSPQRYHLPFIILWGIIALLAYAFLPQRSPDSVLICVYYLLGLWQVVAIFLGLMQLCNQLVSFKNSLWFYFLILFSFNLAAPALLLNEILTPHNLLLSVGIILIFSLIVYESLLRLNLPTAPLKEMTQNKLPIFSPEPSNSVIGQKIFWLLLLFISSFFCFRKLAQQLLHYLIKHQGVTEASFNSFFSEAHLTNGLTQLISTICFIVILPRIGWGRSAVSLPLLTLGMMGLIYFTFSWALIGEESALLIHALLIMSSIGAPVMFVLANSAFILLGSHMKLKGKAWIELASHSFAWAIATFLTLTFFEDTPPLFDLTLIHNHLHLLSFICLIWLVCAFYLHKELAKVQGKISSLPEAPLLPPSTS